MGVVSFLSKLTEKRISASDPPTAEHWTEKLARRFFSFAGVNVTAETAMATAAVYACVRVISETIGSLPLKIYRRRKDGGKDEASDHWLWPVLSQTPNQWQTRLEFLETESGHLCLRGNAFSFRQKDQSGRDQALIPLHPDRMKLEIRGTSSEPVITYVYTGNGTEPEIKFSADEIWHLRGLSSDGFIGLSPLELAQNSIGLSIAAEKHGSKWFANGARPSGVAKYPGKLSENARTNIKKSLNDAMTGDKVYSLVLLEEGLDFNTIGLNNVDSQFLETRQFQVEEIARMFRVPCVLIGHPDKTMTYASVEQLMLSFVVHTIRPWVTRIEQSINKVLLNNDKKYFAEFRLEGLLRGDTKSRYESYASALQNEWMTKNEVRGLENLNPVAGGDEFKNPAINPQQNKQQNGNGDGKESI